MRARTGPALHLALQGPKLWSCPLASPTAPPLPYYPTITHLQACLSRTTVLSRNPTAPIRPTPTDTPWATRTGAPFFPPSHTTPCTDTRACIRPTCLLAPTHYTTHTARHSHSTPGRTSTPTRPTFHPSCTRMWPPYLHQVSIPRTSFPHPATTTPATRHHTEAWPTAGTLPTHTRLGCPHPTRTPRGWLGSPSDQPRPRAGDHQLRLVLGRRLASTCQAGHPYLLRALVRAPTRSSTACRLLQVRTPGPPRLRSAASCPNLCRALAAPRHRASARHRPDPSRTLTHTRPTTTHPTAVQASRLRTGHSHQHHPWLTQRWQAISVTAVEAARRLVEGGPGARNSRVGRQRQEASGGR